MSVNDPEATSAVLITSPQSCRSNPHAGTPVRGPAAEGTHRRAALRANVAEHELRPCGLYALLCDIPCSPPRLDSWQPAPDISAEFFVFVAELSAESWLFVGQNENVEA